MRAIHRTQGQNNLAIHLDVLNPDNELKRAGFQSCAEQRYWPSHWRELQAHPSRDLHSPQGHQGYSSPQRRPKVFWWHRLVRSSSLAFQDPSGDPAPLVPSCAPYGPYLSMAALFVHQAFLPISIAEFVLSQGWMIVILDSVYCVGKFAY